MTNVRAVALTAALTAFALPAGWLAPEGAAQSRTALPRTDGGGVPSPPPVTVSPRRAAAFGAGVVSALFFLQYAHRREPFILLWASGWILIAPAMLLLARGYQSVTVARVGVGASQLLTICTALLFFWSGDVYRRTRFVRPARLKALIPVTIWFLGAPLIPGAAAVMTPGYTISAGLLAAAGALYAAVMIERRMIGAGLVAFILFGLAIVNLASAWVAAMMLSAGWLVFEITLVKSVLYAFAALGMHLMVFEDMTYELRLVNRRLEAARKDLLEASVTDPLTGCHNRRFLDQVIDHELQRHRRFGLPLSLLFVDIDRFKAINDTMGHDTGDRVLRYVASFLKRCIREADYVFRWGGDEFLVLITCPVDEARAKAAALKSAFERDPELASLPAGVGLSVGSVEVPPGTGSIATVIREVDRQMYRDKSSR